MKQRREILGALGAMGLSLALPGFGDDRTARLPVVPDTGTPGSLGQVVVVGGGMAGAATAKYLRLWGGTGIKVTLVERESSYTTNITSNLVLNGSRQLSNLQFQYNRLTGYGINVIKGEVTGITPMNTLAATGGSISLGGTTLPYNRLVLAPGIDFLPLPFVASNTPEQRALVTHAWKAGAQTTTLRDQLAAMPDGGTFIISIPRAPFRASTAPYERACIVADHFRRTNRPNAKILVLDDNSPTPTNPTGIVAGSATFNAAFTGQFAGMITYLPNAHVNSIDASKAPIQVMVDGVTQPFLGNVVNAIPPQKAGDIVTDSGLGLANNSTGRFALVNVLSYESTAMPGIHVVGDSCSTAPQPKAGHMGNQQGKVCADAIVRLLRPTPLALDTSPATATVGFSPITANTASWFTTVFQATPAVPAVPAAMVAKSSGEAAKPTGENFEQLFNWFGELHADTLG